MYSHSGIAVDKGLGFDFSDITNLVKTALPAGLNIFQNQMQLKQIKAISAANVNAGYGVPVIGLPSAQMYGQQPTFGGGYVAPPRSMFDTSTILMIGGAAVIGLLAYKLMQ
jgi:hypothetical protein